MRDFLRFIKEQGVMGLAVGFILGGAVTALVTSLVNDIVYPLLGVILGSTKGLEKEYFQIGHSKLLYGHFIAVLVNFLVIAVVIYVLVKLLRFEIPGRKK